MTNTTILVIGSTGKTGKRVADQLERRGIDVRHGSRSADIPFDWDDSQTWAASLTAVDKVYITYYPDLAVPARSTPSGSSLNWPRTPRLRRPSASSWRP